jgi:glycerol-3-phosphate responsive antiterminator
VQGTGVAADSVRVIRQVRQLQKRFVQVSLEVVSLIDSHIAKLRAKADAARAEGRELLNEMAEDVKRRVDGW